MLSPSTLPCSAQPGFARTFKSGRLTLGLFFPIESFASDTPSMEGQAELAKAAEAAGFAALWVRDIPLRDPGFGDLGQIFDPFVYLGYIAAQTSAIALATGSIVVPIRNPLHLAKAATSVDQLSGGRLLLGVASGDRPVEFPAFGVDAERRGEILREHIDVLRMSQRTSFAALQWSAGSLAGADMIPKPFAEEVPLLVTGRSRQSMDWIAGNAHGWITYPRSPDHQQVVIQDWRAAVLAQCGRVFKPFSQSLYLDLSGEPDEPPQQIHLGYRLGRSHLIALLEVLQSLGVNHVMLNLRFGQRPVFAVLEELERHVLPLFPAIIHNSQGLRGCQ
ncbi:MULTISPECIES: LLM class oxidoreductase [Paraburkholderia]|uniref:LLM class oxidoreductase n=1 Tax=Paraburkholderia TaxID=1822464 RepID=UPI000D07E0C1|nr:LLM class oxidoreductase [Paraburkholderia fungorum]PRZ55972.1 luciferase-type oxidoreductase [Paraburkholderia fungorum]